MKIFDDVKQNLYFLIQKAKKNYLLLIIFGSVFILGFILGLIFNDRFIFVELSNGNLLIVEETGFFGCFFKLFLIYLKTIIFLFLFSLIKKLYFCTFIIPFLRGAECAILIIKTIEFYSLIGVFGILILLIAYMVLIFLTFSFFCYVKENQHCGVFIDKISLLCLTKYALKLLILTLIISFILSIIFCFSIGGLF